MSDSEFNAMRNAVEIGDAIIHNVQPRWKSWALWLSVIGAVWTILNALGLPAKWGIEETTVKTIVDAVGVILIAFGLVNDPSNPDAL